MQEIVKGAPTKQKDGMIEASCPFCKLLNKVPCNNSYGWVSGVTEQKCGHLWGAIDNQLTFKGVVRNGLQLLGDMLDERLAKFEIKG